MFCNCCCLQNTRSADFHPPNNDRGFLTFLEYLLLLLTSSSMRSLLLVAAVCLLHSALGRLWPSPKTLVASIQSVPFATNFKVTIRGGDFESEVASTFTAWIKGVLPNTSRVNGNKAITEVDVVVDATLKFPYSYTTLANYSILKTVNSSKLSVNAGTTLGAIHALATIMQMAVDNACPTTINITDEPDFAYRAINLDVSSRWLPLDSIQKIIDGMALTKLNVLNLRLSDNEAVRYKASNTSSDLTDYANAYYTDSDVDTLVKYASIRGVVIIPEFNLPVHAQSYSHSDVDFCADSKQALAGTDATMAVVTPLLATTEQHFQQSIISVVGVEPDSKVNDTCVDATLTAIAQAMTTKAGYIHSQPLCWEGADCQAKVVFKSYPPDNTTGNYIFSSTSPTGLTLPTTAMAGYGAYAQYANKSCQGAQAIMSLYSMCSDASCNGDNTTEEAALSWMASRDQDEVAATAVVNTLFPSVVAMAGGLWNGRANVTTTDVKNVIKEQAKVYARFGFSNCTCGACNLTHGCDGPYTATAQDIPTLKFGFVFGCALAGVVVLSILIVEVRYCNRKQRDEYTPLLN
eukprot:TRINITY_DN8814_c0_g1_i1.p2 TRINITY_DN8814_c0_g1~~TRINITY_DN8814_c0_g1_i1.p2  ORF type:complete len:576 (+),score=146.50 TRINITY_DN8814_c0_g1_i1:3005-4732(+)